MLHREGIAIPSSTSINLDRLGASFKWEFDASVIFENLIDAPRLQIAWMRRPSSIVLTLFPFCHENLVRVQRKQHESFPIVSNTVGQLQDSAALRKFEVTEV